MTHEAATIAADFNGRLGAFALNVAFTAPAHGITALFGPSGCGKTTVLRCMAGLSRLKGRLKVADEIWQDDATGTFRKPHQRHVGYVFQEASLFAHLSVRGNLLYGAHRAGADGGPEPLSFDDTVSLLGIGPLLDRAPDALSGGERQRVAVARALAPGPEIVFADEPTGNLDSRSGTELLSFLRRAVREFGQTVVMVTHDPAAAAYADRAVFLADGRVLDDLDHPTVERVLDRIGSLGG
jgi:molybdate transport system ATP-binding protein